MHKPSFWRGYLAGIGLMLALGFGTIYYFFLRIPDISLTQIGLEELDGRPYDPAPLVGQRVVLNYWATWCGPCIEEFPIFEQAQRQAGAGTTFLVVSDELAATIQRFLRKHPLGFRMLRVHRPLPGVNSRPVTYGFGRRGQLSTTHMGTITAPDLHTFVAGL
ncbi:MAG: TlpA family protein disulfide reductase [Bacteroidota bacterium]|nr:TlpA family protein disulfide reductase [Bacteroidota bacterium]